MRAEPTSDPKLLLTYLKFVSGSEVHAGVLACVKQSTVYTVHGQFDYVTY